MGTYKYEKGFKGINNVSLSFYVIFEYAGQFAP